MSPKWRVFGLLPTPSAEGLNSCVQNGGTTAEGCSRNGSSRNGSYRRLMHRQGRRCDAAPSLVLKFVLVASQSPSDKQLGALLRVAATHHQKSNRVSASTLHSVYLLTVRHAHVCWHESCYRVISVTTLGPLQTAGDGESPQATGCDM